MLIPMSHCISVIENNKGIEIGKMAVSCSEHRVCIPCGWHSARGTSLRTATLARHVSINPYVTTDIVYTSQLFSYGGDREQSASWLRGNSLVITEATTACRWWLIECPQKRALPSRLHNVRMKNEKNW
ncbi:hypothetical protein V1478_001843 [Vespula squamosa]|uniref:Uncharacterized protein n=1 Tax=Vespula squamosa TaxID=30214 RepID=A0ABD2BYA2_VESSQ